MPDDYVYQPYPAWRTHPTLPPQLVETAEEDEALLKNDPRWVDPAKPVKPPKATPEPAPTPAPGRLPARAEPEPEPEATPVHEKPPAPKPAAKASAAPARRSK